MFAGATATSAVVGSWVTQAALFSASSPEGLAFSNPIGDATSHLAQAVLLLASAAFGCMTLGATNRLIDLTGHFRRMRATGTGRSIAKALREQWPACGITAIGMDDERTHPVLATRGTHVSFPNGSDLVVSSRIGIMGASFKATHGGQRMHLSSGDVALVAHVLDGIQRMKLASETGLSFVIGANALSQAIGEACPIEVKSRRVERSHDLGQPAMIVETRRIPRGPVVITTRYENAPRPFELLVAGTSTGTLRLPVDAFASITRGDEAQRTSLSLGKTPTKIRTPILTTHERAERLSLIARKALKRDPDLADATGAPIAALVDRHLPRLVETHRKAHPSVRQQADETLDRGLDVVARAVGESIDALASRDLDDLRTEVLFLESRHPQRDPLLSTETRP